MNSNQGETERQERDRVLYLRYLAMLAADRLLYVQ